MGTPSKHRILATILAVIASLFLVSLFKNISYPLLWNDEAETAMYAKRILDYGYPKIHDGKNVVYLLELQNTRLGVNEKMDAWTALAWGQYYFATIGAFFAEKVDDMYSKTAILRIPFAVAGLLGIAVMGALAAGLFRRNLTHMLIYLVLFALFELLSVSLVLHLREVRSYSMSILLSACLFYSYMRYAGLRKMGAVSYVVSATVLLVLLFNNMSVSYFIATAAIGLFNLLEFLKARNVRMFVTSSAPLLISLIVVIPLLIFFDVLRLSQEFATFFQMSSGIHPAHVSFLLNFFVKYEFLYLVLSVKVVTLILRFCQRSSMLRKATVDEVTSVKQRLFLSDFLSLYFIIHILAVAKIPYPVIYERYVIGLQPVMVLVLLLDASVVFELLWRLKDAAVRRNGAVLALVFVGILFAGGMSNKFGLMKGHVYELFHQYKGPLDYAIPYIKNNYKNTDNLVIATNYEECSYMYYLNSKVIIGSVGNNLVEDMKANPDLIILRKKWSYTSKQEIFAPFTERNKYTRVSFPVFDYYVNNIPETSIHLFRTKMAENASQRLDMYIKTNLNITK